MERETGFEPATNSLEGCDSTPELLPRSRHGRPVVGQRRGLEKSGGGGWIRTTVGLRRQIYSLLPLSTRPHLQSSVPLALPSGAGTRTRTEDLLITSQLLYQLSYAGRPRRRGFGGGQDAVPPLGLAPTARQRIVPALVSKLKPATRRAWLSRRFSGGSLPDGLIEHRRGGGRQVERLDAPAHRQADQPVAELAGLSP